MEINMEYLKYSIEDSTIAELLGVQNFSNDEAAVLELVKNAYDANALIVTLDFIDKTTLKITDNGDGMDSEDIKKYWMHIGKSNKGYDLIDTNNNVRVQAGAKGVHLFQFVLIDLVVLPLYLFLQDYHLPKVLL